MPATKEQFSDREIQILAAAFQCLKDPNAMQIEYEKFARIAGFKSIGGARNAFTAIKKKLLNGDQTDSSSAATPKKNSNKAATPATPVQEDEEENDEAGVNDSEIADSEKTPGASPPKKPKAKAARKSKAKATTVKVEEEDYAEPAVNDEDDAAAPVTPSKPKRKYTRKPKDPNAPPTKRAKKETAATPAVDDDDEQQVASNSNDNNEDVGTIKGEDDRDDEFGVQTASQEQFAVENALVPGAF